MDALFMAVKQRRPLNKVLVHSDQGSQFASDDWNRLCRKLNLEPSMSRRGNCWDNAVVESFFSTLKKDRIRDVAYPTLESAKADIFDYVEVFYNRKRRHGHIGGISPLDFEMQKMTCENCLQNQGKSIIHNPHLPFETDAHLGRNDDLFTLQWVNQ